MFGPWSDLNGGLQKYLHKRDDLHPKQIRGERSATNLHIREVSVIMGGVFVIKGIGLSAAGSYVEQGPLVVDVPAPSRSAMN